MSVGLTSFSALNQFLSRYDELPPLVTVQQDLREENQKNISIHLEAFNNLEDVFTFETLYALLLNRCDVPAVYNLIFQNTLLYVKVSVEQFIYALAQVPSAWKMSFTYRIMPQDKMMRDGTRVF